MNRSGHLLNIFYYFITLRNSTIMDETKNPEADLYNLTSAPYPVILDVKGEDKEFWLTMLSDQQETKLDNWVKAKLVSLVRDSFEHTENMTSAQRNSEIVAVTKAASYVTHRDPDVFGIMDTLEGSSLWLSELMHEKHPEYDTLACRKLLYYNLPNKQAVVNTVELMDAAIVEAMNSILKRRSKGNAKKPDPSQSENAT